MVCDKCTRIPFILPEGHVRTEHHSSFTELDSSAKSGCSICVLFRIVLLEYDAHNFSCSIEEAESYHRLTDQTSQLCKGEQGRSTKAPRFYVEPVYMSFSENTESWEGLRGFLFMRQDPRYTDNACLPSKNVIPLVKVLSLSGTLFPAHNK